MAAPPPGADVQDGKRPTAAGLAVIGREPPGSLPCKRGGNRVSPAGPLLLRRARFTPHLASRPARPASGRTPMLTGHRPR